MGDYLEKHRQQSAGIMTITRIILRMAIIIMAVEFLIMLVLQILPMRLEANAAALVDAVALVLLSTPFIYFWVVRPFVLARDEAVAETARMAYHDALTRLPNRRLLMDHLEQALASCYRHKVYGALMLIDLDDFKPVNDVHGHEAGDAVLIQVADRLRSMSRREDTACRLGGDEFMLVALQLDANRDRAATKAVQLADKIQQSISQPIAFDRVQHRIGSSIGVLLIGDLELGAAAAIKEADTAMYEAKKADKGSVFLIA